MHWPARSRYLVLLLTILASIPYNPLIMQEERELSSTMTEADLPQVETAEKSPQGPTLPYGRLNFDRFLADSHSFRNLSHISELPDPADTSITAISKKSLHRSSLQRLADSAPLIATLADSAAHLETHADFKKHNLLGKDNEVHLETLISQQDFHARERLQPTIDANVDALLTHSNLSQLSSSEFSQLCSDRLAGNPNFLAELKRRLLEDPDFIMDDVPGPDGQLTNPRFPLLYHQLQMAAQKDGQDYLQIWADKCRALTSDLPLTIQLNPTMRRGLPTLGLLQRHGQFGPHAEALLQNFEEKKYDSINDFDYRLFNEQLIADLGEPLITSLLAHREQSNMLVFLHERQSALYDLFVHYCQALRQDVSLGDFNEHCELGLRFIFNNHQFLRGIDTANISPAALLDYIIYNQENPHYKADFSNNFQAELSTNFTRNNEQINNLINELTTLRYSSENETDSDRIDDLIASLPPETQTLIHQQIDTSVDTLKEIFVGSSTKVISEFANQYRFFEEKLYDRKTGDPKHLSSEQAAQYGLSQKDHENINTLADFIFTFADAKQNYQSFVDLFALVSEKIKISPTETFHLEKSLSDYCRESFQRQFAATSEAIAKAKTETVAYKRQHPDGSVTDHAIKVIDLAQNPALLDKLGLLIHNNHTGWKPVSGSDGTSVDFTNIDYAQNWAAIDPHAHSSLSTSYLDGHSRAAEAGRPLNFAHVPAENPGSVLYGFLGGDIIAVSTDNIDVDSSHFTLTRKHSPSFRAADSLGSSDPKYYNEVLLQRAGAMPDCIVLFEREFTTGPILDENGRQLSDGEDNPAAQAALDRRNREAALKAAADWQAAPGGLNRDLPIIYINASLFDGSKIHR